jgi:hypothetical protein
MRAPADSKQSQELRAAMSVTRLWRDQNLNVGRDLLAPVYNWFTEGSTLNLKVKNCSMTGRLNGAHLGTSAFDDAVVPRD